MQSGVLWTARLAWLLAAVLGGAAIGGALDDSSRAVQLTGTAGAWLGFAVGAVALAIVGTATLTLVRAVVPGGLVVAAFTAIGGADPGAVLALAAPVIAATALVSCAEFGRSYVQASAYGDEVRFGLRPPIGYLGASVVAWLLVAVAVVTAPLAWAGRQWAVAVVATLLAAAGLAVFPSRWHRLTRRWLVLVPAGLVLHDPVVLADTLMVRKPDLASISLDELGVAAQRAADLTGPTPGLAVEVHLRETTTAVLARSRLHRQGGAIHLTGFVCSPTRPGAVVRAAESRGLPVG